MISPRAEGETINRKLQYWRVSSGLPSSHWLASSFSLTSAHHWLGGFPEAADCVHRRTGTVNWEMLVQCCAQWSRKGQGRRLAFVPSGQWRKLFLSVEFWIHIKLTELKCALFNRASAERLWAILCCFNLSELEHFFAWNNTCFVYCCESEFKFWSWTSCCESKDF